MRTLGLTLCSCAMLVNAAAAGADPEQPLSATATYDEMNDFAAGLQARADLLNRAAGETDEAIEFLFRQIEDAIDKLSSGHLETVALRRQNLDLSSERDRATETQVELGFEIARLHDENEQTVTTLENEVQKLASLLSLERRATTELRRNLDENAAELRATIGEQDQSRRQHLEARKTFDTRISALTESRDGLRVRLSAAESEVARARDKLAAAEQDKAAEAALLGRQIAALRRQLARLVLVLESAEAANEDKEVRIANLGKRLNIALATRVTELARYRSEFFGRLRQVLDDRQDIRIVGDRFVFQSEVLFNAGEAELEAAGRRQLQHLARSLKEITATIPADIDWVLRIDGHTDERPIQTPRYPSNWELSTARAVSVAKFLIEEEIPASRLIAAGFAEFHPLDKGRDEIAFRRNRRIEFKLTQK